jgi:orotate phosphoribosyltransferase
MERLALRPEFEGDVHTGKRYVLVDDVTSLGGTLAELGNYIQSNGGIVAGIFVLVNAGPDGQSKFPHPWPPQIPPGSAARL